MARTFRRNRQMHALSELNVTNLLDLAFVLLIIFMIVTPVINQEQKMEVALPVESASDQTPTRSKTTDITIKGADTFFIDGENRPLNLAALRSRLAALAREDSDRSVIIRSDASSSFLFVVTVMDELKKVGLTKVGFATQVSGG